MPAWPDHFDAALPPVRRDEPSGLRQDIDDELADHLACAFRREERRGADAPEAAQRVYARFGDPAVVARELYLAAMKERIMRDRLLSGAMLIITATVVVSLVAGWRAFQRSDRTNDAILAELKSLRAAVQMANVAAASEAYQNESSWTSLTMRLQEEGDSARPAIGASVSLHGYLLNTAQKLDLAREADERGWVHFDKLLVGAHECTVTYGGLTTFAASPISLLPGRPQETTLVTPKSDGYFAPVRYRVANAGALPEGEYLLSLVIEADSPVEVAGRSWFPARNEVSVRCRDGIVVEHAQVAGSYGNWIDGRGPVVSTRETDQRLIGGHLIQALQLILLEDTANSPRPWRVRAGYCFGAAVPMFICNNSGRSESPHFTVKPGGPNEWTITIPDELIDLAHQAAGAGRE